MGYQAETGNGWAAAIGSEAQTTGTASTAVGGLSASATVDYGAAFGSFSVAQRASGVAGYLANGQNGSAWKSNLGAFSVGNDVKGFSRQITGVAAGSEDTDAVNVAQLKALEKKLIKVLPEVVGDQKTGVVVEKNPKENTSTPSTSETAPPTGGVTTSLTSRTTPPTGVTTPPTSETAPPTSVTAQPTGVTTQPTGVMAPSMGETVLLTRETVRSADVTAPPTGVTITTTAPTDESKTVYKVKLDKKVDVGNISIDGNENKETITIGKGDNHVTVDTTGLTIANGPSVTKSGINVNKNKITNVGDGTISEDSTKAVNGKQLYGVEQNVSRNTTNIKSLQNNMYDMGMKVGELDTRVNKVGAGAAALAALHPQEFEPEDKWGIAAGVGNYKNATAAAVGLFYRPNERTLLNLGWTMGDSRNMVNAGVSVKLGSGSTYAGFSKVQMANRLTQQEEKITAQEQEIKELREREEQREKQMQEILSKLKMMEKTKA